MQVELHMVGVHKNANITIKGVKFTNGKAMVYGADELVGNICRYLEAYGAFLPHEAERRQAILDGEGEKGSLKAARRRMQRLQEEMAKAQADMDAATEAVEAKMMEDEAKERSSASMETASGKVENKTSTEGRSGKPSGSGKSSKNED